LNQYIYDGKADGGAASFNANYGLPLGKNGGYINLSGNFISKAKTYRQDIDTSNLFTNAEALPINIYRRAHGDGSVAGGGGFVNSEIPISNSTASFYFFGGANYSRSDAYAFTRNFSARPDRFPTDADGNLIDVPGIIRTSGDGESYFNPHIQTHINDLSMAIGVRGETKGKWNWDLSNNTGRNNFHFYGDETLNASLGAEQTHFDDGGFSFLQNTTNLDFHKAIEGIAQGFNVAAGAEFRFEQYNLFAGEEASYTNYDTSGEKATGSQGFPGYQPGDEVTASRNTMGIYGDVELDVTKSWLIEGAVRLENYSDFGFTPNFKVATRVKVAKRFNLRGSFSTGFRAPSLQQINFSSTFTTVTGGTISEVKIAPNYSPITKAAGIPELKQETAINAGAGFAWNPVKDFSITVDGYLVQIQDRVVLSGAFSVDDQTLDPVLVQALRDLGVSQAQFFANAVNTTNQGIDIVLDYNHAWGDQYLRILLAGNLQDMTIDKINVPDKLNDNDAHRQNFLSDREQSFILASAPDKKFALNLEYGIKKLMIGTRFTYFGEVTILGYGDDGLGIDPMVPTDADPYVLVPDEYVYSGKVVTDLYFGYRISKNLNLNIGADNIFNVHPDLGVVQSAKYWAFNNETGGPWDAVQMGGNGLQLFARLGLTF
ncbi:MAG: TonB-dependent receptor, partial [Chitinophagales bacterium]